MLETAKSISVIICAYTEERWHDLVKAVDSLHEQIVPPLEIVVVIDHNADLFVRAKEQWSNIIVTESSEARGLSGARNHGIAIAKGKFVAFLDDDAVAEPDWLQRLSKHFEDPDILGVGGAVEPYWLSKQPSWFPEEFYWVLGCSYSGLPQTLSVVRNPYGGCTCFLREVFEVVGGFREGIGRVGSNPMGGEETELCIRAKQRWPHKVFLYDPQARIHHRIPPHRANWRYFRLRCYAEGVSKAIVSGYVGAKDSLASERLYVCKTLLRGILHGLRDGVARQDLSGLLRAGAIVTGFLLTALGYIVGIVFHRPPLKTSIPVNSTYHTFTASKG
jgi:glycosyltransferase involved in cell wall biosynthesis